MYNVALESTATDSTEISQSSKNVLVFKLNLQYALIEENRGHDIIIL